MNTELKQYDSYYPVKYDYVDQVPKGWQLLPNIGIFQERIERGFPDEELLSVTMGRGIIKQSELGKKDSSTLDKSKYLLVYPNDLVYSMRFRQGASGYSNYKGIVSPACTVLKPKKDAKYNPRYFYYMFRTRFYKNYVERFAYGIADGQIPLRYIDFKRMYSIFPPIEIQNAIVTYLDKKNEEIKKFIRNKSNLIKLLEEQKKTVINKAVSKGINDDNHFKETGFSFIGKTPQNWNVKPLKHFVTLISEQTKKKANDEIYVALENIESWTGKLNLEIGSDEFDSTAKRFSPNDVLFSKLRPYLAKAILAKQKGVCVGELLVLRPSKQIFSDFLLYKILSKQFIDYVDSSSYGTKMPRASWSFIGKIPIAFPNEDFEEQTLIVDFIKKEIEKLDKTIKTTKQEISAINEYTESLITNLITGKKAVPS